MNLMIVWRLPVMTAVVLGLTMGVTLVGCESAKPVYTYKERGDTSPRRRVYGEEQQRESVFGSGGLFGDGQASASPGGAGGGGGGVAVNSFLWRASLDTVAFMPLSSADPFGGTIITDWHVLPESPNERFKVNVFIMSRALRADGVKVSVFREIKDPTGAWVSGPVDPETITGLENSILTKARELRMSNAP